MPASHIPASDMYVLYELTIRQNKVDGQLIYLRLIWQIFPHSLMMKSITVLEIGLLLTWTDAQIYVAICIQSAEAKLQCGETNSKLERKKEILHW
jgi:hypothetical protein